MDVFTDESGKKIIKPKDKIIQWRISAYSLILEKNKVLVVVPTWSDLFELPGGGVHEDESINDGLKRECREETGYNLKNINNEVFYLGEQQFYLRTQEAFYNSLILVFMATIDSLANKTERRKQEIKKAEWIYLLDLDERNTHRVIYPAIKKLQSV